VQIFLELRFPEVWKSLWVLFQHNYTVVREKIALHASLENYPRAPTDIFISKVDFAEPLSDVLNSLDFLTFTRENRGQRLVGRCVSVLGAA